MMSVKAKPSLAPAQVKKQAVSKAPAKPVPVKPAASTVKKPAQLSKPAAKKAALSKKVVDSDNDDDEEEEEDNSDAELNADDSPDNSDADDEALALKEVGLPRVGKAHNYDADEDDSLEFDEEEVEEEDGEEGEEDADEDDEDEEEDGEEDDDDDEEGEEEEEDGGDDEDDEDEEEEDEEEEKQPTKKQLQQQKQKQSKDQLLGVKRKHEETAKPATAPTLSRPTTDNVPESKFMKQVRAMQSNPTTATKRAAYAAPDESLHELGDDEVYDWKIKNGDEDAQKAAERLADDVREQRIEAMLREREARNAELIEARQAEAKKRRARRRGIHRQPFVHKFAIKPTYIPFRFNR